MNIFQFVGLMRAIYGSKKPDIETIQKNGLLAVKIAQHFALRIDFLDEKVCRELSKLFRAAVFLDPDGIENLLKENCPAGWINNFSRFDTKAFASASIGQVHRGTLLNEERVVIKLIKQDNRKQFIADLQRIESFLRFIIKIHPAELFRVFNPLEALEYIKSYTLNELDLQNEIKGGETLAKIQLKYQNIYDLSLLRFPNYYPDISNSNALVSEYIEGRTFDELLNSGQLEYKTLLSFLKIHGFYLFAVGYFHGDIHPGNIILDKHGKITLVDNGAISYVAKNTREGLFDFIDTLSHFDYLSAAQCLYAMSHNDITEEKLKKFEQDFLNLYKDFTHSTVSEVSLTKKMMQTIKLGVNNGMTFGDDIFGILKGLMYLDGMILRCNPQAKLIHDIREFTGALKSALSKMKDAT